MMAACRRSLTPFFLAATFILLARGVASADRLYAIGQDGRTLVTIPDAAAPGTATILAITGLAAGEELRGFDVNFVSNELIGVTSHGRFVTVNTTSGAASPGGPIGFTPAGTIAGFDWTSSTGAMATTDAGELVRFDYVYTSPSPVTLSPPRTFSHLAVHEYQPDSSELHAYAIDTATDQLVRIVFGAVVTVTDLGPLGIDASVNGGFDITLPGIGYAAFDAPGGAHSLLYRINLVTGQATLVGQIGAGLGPVRGVSADVPGHIGVAGVYTSLSEGSQFVAQVFRRGSPEGTLDVQVNTISLTALEGVDYVPLSQNLTFPAHGARTFNVTAQSINNSTYQGVRQFRIALSSNSGTPIYPIADTLTIQDDEPPSQAPVITIQSPTTGPTYTVSGGSIALAGIASDPDGSVTHVSWITDQSIQGIASGTSSWYIPEIPLRTGSNTIYVTAVDNTNRATSVGLTVNVPSLSYYLAEGATGGFFDLDVAIANPSSTDAPVTVQFLPDRGDAVTQSLTIPGQRRITLKVDSIAGLDDRAVSTVVTSSNGSPLIVERTMRWSETGQYGAHGEKAAAGPAPAWYFAEGSQGFFSTYILLTNPQTTASSATLQFLPDGGSPLTRTYPLAPLSRRTIYAGDIPELVDRSFGTVVTFAQPGVAERAMYFRSSPGELWRAGHESAGVNAPATSWFLAEGATGPFFDTFVLLANPGAEPADVLLTFLPAAGAPVERTLTMAPQSRHTVNLEALTPAAPSLASAAVATRVTASRPIIVERAQYWPYTAAGWYEAHNSFGVTALGTSWGLAEGRVGNPAGWPAGDYQTYVLLANPAMTAATVTVTFLRGQDAPIVKTFEIAAQSRRNVMIAGPNSDVPELANELFGAVVQSTQPIAVERAMYSTPAGGLPFEAGSNATATRLP
jgi:hypothetical protein